MITKTGKFRRGFLKLGLAYSLLGVTGFSGIAMAADWPQRAVTFIVPFAPGGPVDTVARIVTMPFNSDWQYPVVIDNKAGAGGIVGARTAAKSKPDGHNFFFGAIHHAILPSLNNKLGYEIGEDLVPVAGIARFPLILVAHPSLKVKTVQELIDLAKAEPNKIAYSSSGTGGGTHLAGELFANQAGVQLQHIPYSGSAPAMQDLVGGQVQLMFADATSALPFIKTGQVVPLGVGNQERSALAPELPTISEAGLPGYEAYSWSGLYAPKGTPQEVIDKVAAEFGESLNNSAIVERMTGSGSEPMFFGPQEFAKFTQDEVAKWRDTIQKANIVVQ